MRLFRHELRAELLLYRRSRELAFFTFLLPMIFFVLLGSTYGDDRIKSEGGVRGSNFLEAGMIGYGAISIAFAGLAIVLVIRRESGVLKRLRATPLPAPAYVAIVDSFTSSLPCVAWPRPRPAGSAPPRWPSPPCARSCRRPSRSSERACAAGTPAG